MHPKALFTRRRNAAGKQTMHVPRYIKNIRRPYYVHIVTTVGRLIRSFQLPWGQDGVFTLLEAKCRAAEMIAGNTNNSGLVVIVTEGTTPELDQTQRLVLSRVKSPNGAAEKCSA